MISSPVEPAEIENDRVASVKKPKPTHYKVICVSLYTRDLEAISAKVAELKRRGWTKMTRSELIRIACEKLDVDHMTFSSFSGKREDAPT